MTYHTKTTDQLFHLSCYEGILQGINIDNPKYKLYFC